MLGSLAFRMSNYTRFGNAFRTEIPSLRSAHLALKRGFQVTKSAVRKLSSALLLTLLAVPAGIAVAQSTSKTAPTPTIVPATAPQPVTDIVTGTDPEPTCSTPGCMR